MLAFFTPGPYDMLIILAIALLVFGNRLPSVMRSLGSSVNEFKRGLADPPLEAPVTQAPAFVPAPVQTSSPSPKQMP